MCLQLYTQGAAPGQTQHTTFQAAGRRSQRLVVAVTRLNYSLC